MICAVGEEGEKEEYPLHHKRWGSQGEETAVDLSFKGRQNAIWLKVDNVL